MKVRSTSLIVKIFVSFLICACTAFASPARADGSAGYLLVGSWNNGSVLRYDATTGAFVDVLAPKNNGGLRKPGGVVFGPDGNIYVGNGWEWDAGVGHKNVLRYDGITGAFIDDFADENLLTSPRQVLFGPDGNLYVVDGTAWKPGHGVLRFDGKTGAFTGVFVGPNGGDLSGAVFGPDGTNDGKLDLYVTDVFAGSVLRYDGTTGAFKGVFVKAGSGGLSIALGVVFGPDGNLYVASGSSGDLFSGTPGMVTRYQGPGGTNPGAFIDTFIPGGSGGLANPCGLLFGPDGNLYVTSAVTVSAGQQGAKGIGAVPGTSMVLRYDGKTGAFLNTFVTPDSGGLDYPVYMTFTKTNPTTLNYVP